MIFGIAIAAIMAARILFALPLSIDRVDSTALAVPESASWAAPVTIQGATPAYKTDVRAFGTRMILMDAAVSSLDAQDVICPLIGWLSVEWLL